MRLLLLLALLAAPAALAQKPADDKPDDGASADPFPFVGTWSYVVRPEDPLARGSFTVEPGDDALAGTIMTDTDRPIDPFVPDGDAITFSFKQPGMGTITIRGRLAGDDFQGEAEPEGQDPVPFVATRQPDDAGMPEPAADADPDAPDADVLGTWAYTLTPPGDNPMTGSFSLERGPDGLTGTIQTDAPRALRGVEVSGRRLVFSFDQPGMGVVHFRGTVEGDAFTGEAKPAMMPAAPVTAERVPSPTAADSD